MNEWKKFSDEFPPASVPILFCEEHDNKVFGIAYVSNDNRVYSYGYFCNRPDCSWIFDDCGCELEIGKTLVWMAIPFPERKKDE